MPQCIRKDGLHKTSFSNRAAARKAARGLQSVHGRMEPYKCSEHGYHVGHPTPKRTQP